MSLANLNDSASKGKNAVYQRAMINLLYSLNQSSSGGFLTNDQTVTGSTVTLPQTPVFIYGVYKNGQKLTVTTDYSIAGNTITFVNALAADLISTVYKI